MLFSLNNGYKTVHKIYSLINPINNSVFYVGCTGKTLKERLAFHLSAARSEPGSYKKRAYINSIINSGYIPVIKILQEVESTTFNEFLKVIDTERYWIRYFKDKTQLVNTKHMV